VIFGVIGIGSMGRNHVRVLSEIKKVDKILIYDKNKKIAEEIANKFDAIITKSVEELIRKSDAISICVPTSLHYKYTKTCIESEKHTFVEKPLASSLDEGKRLQELLKTKKIIFGVGHIERFNPIIPEIVKLNLDIEYVDIKRHNPASSRISDASVVEDLMIHDIDIVFNVLLPKKKKYEVHSAGNENVVQSLIDFGGATISLSASRISSKKIRKIYIENSEMTIEGDFMSQELYLYKQPSTYQLTDERYVQENIIEKVLINKVEPLKVELKTFVDCIDENQEFPVTVDEAVKNLKICEIIKNQIRTRRFRS